GAKVTIWANTSKWTVNTTSDASGEFRFDNVALGSCTVQVEAEGFAPQTQQMTLASEGELRLHFALTVAGSKESVQVTDITSAINPASSTWSRGPVSSATVRPSSSAVTAATTRPATRSASATILSASPITAVCPDIEPILVSKLRYRRSSTTRQPDSAASLLLSLIR